MTLTDWIAPAPTESLDFCVELPGSKSITNRELVLAATAQGESRLCGALRARDTDLMIAGLRTLGAEIVADGSDVTVRGPLRPSSVASVETSFLRTVECGLAGTVMRFLPPLASLIDQPVTFTADEEALARPLHEILELLQQHGASVHFESEATFPFTITSPLQLPTQNVGFEVDARASSQFLTAAALLAAAAIDQVGRVSIHAHGPIPSAPHLEMTWQCLRRRGLQVQTTAFDNGDLGVTISGAQVAARNVVIEPDLSNAGPFLVAAAICGGRVGVRHWPRETTQPGDLWRELLTEYGAEVTWEDPHADHCTLWVSGSGEPGRGFNRDLSRAGELVPTLAALAAHAGEASVLSGIGHLRGHETDRLRALETELLRCGVWAKAEQDSLIIDPTRPLEGGGQAVEGGAGDRGLPSSGKQMPTPDAATGGTAATPEESGIVMETYHDHRMATFAALMGLRRPGTRVKNVATTAKTLPNFVALWEALTKPSGEGSDGAA